MRGYIWCIGWETPHFEETSPIWDYSESLWLESSGGGGGASPFWEDSASQCLDLSHEQVVDGIKETERWGEEEPTR